MDPNKDTLARGENFDIERTPGEVTGKSVKYFVGNDADSTSKKGKPYYILTVLTYGKARAEDFIGVPTHIFDSVEVGTKLHIRPSLSLKHLASLEGKIIDRYANLEQNKFFVVVDDSIKIRAFQVDMDLFYRKLDIGTRLPIEWNQTPAK